MYLQAALITALTTILISVAVYFVGKARGKYQIHAPAITGHPDFERAFRAHQNTLEQTVVFLPVLWLATIYSFEMVAASLGYIWLAGRLWYLFGYISAAGKRGMGFMISSLAFLGLLSLSLWGVIGKMI